MVTHDHNLLTGYEFIKLRCPLICGEWAPEFYYTPCHQISHILPRGIGKIRNLISSHAQAWLLAFWAPLLTRPQVFDRWVVSAENGNGMRAHISSG